MTGVPLGPEPPGGDFRGTPQPGRGLLFCQVPIRRSSLLLSSGGEVGVSVFEVINRPRSKRASPEGPSLPADSLPAGEQSEAVRAVLVAFDIQHEQLPLPLGGASPRGGRQSARGLLMRQDSRRFAWSLREPARICQLPRPRVMAFPAGAGAGAAGGGRAEPGLSTLVGVTGTWSETW